MTIQVGEHRITVSDGPRQDELLDEFAHFLSERGWPVSFPDMALTDPTGYVEPLTVGSD